MNWLSIEEVEVLADEFSLIKPYRPPSESNETGEEHWDFKYPVHFSGRTNNSTEKEEVVTIEPNDFEILQTEERINTLDYGQGQNIHIMGFIYLPHSFVATGIFPCFQGLIDTNYPSNPLNIVLYNGSDNALNIEQDSRIAYVFFSYLRTGSFLEVGAVNSSIPGPEKGPETSEGISKAQERIEELERKVEELEAKTEVYSQRSSE